MGLLNLIEQVVEMTSGADAIAVTTDIKPYITEMTGRLKLTPMQALLLSVFVNQSDDNRIQYRDLAHHFGVNTISVLAVSDVIDELVRLGVIVRRIDNDGDYSFRVPNKTIKSLRENKLPEPEKRENLSAHEWIGQVADLLKLRSNNEMEDEELECVLEELIEKNQQLHLAQKLKSFNLRYPDLLLYLVMSICYIDNHDDRICRGDFDDYFPHRTYREHAEALEEGSHPLQTFRLIEFSCVEGQIENDKWCLTEYSKTEVYSELKLKPSKNAVRSNMTRPEDINEKKLYYNERVTRQVNQLHSLLDKERMKDVMARLSDKGMRKGFTCLFYGGPGTGKTETAMQLAKATGRDVMLVDVPSIRSKWVGETEKNIKDLFDRYRHAAKGNDLAPILLFNEADALLNKRNEGTTNSVDKMENSMQNIILQEMENLEGIMIATTNLTGTLDAAFERRFLYKIEFDKPAPAERRHIWQAMLPDLTDDDALSLAQRYDFSGGQIENIARKRVIDDILSERDTLDLNAIIESCDVELLNKKSLSKIGFAC